MSILYFFLFKFISFENLSNLHESKIRQPIKIHGIDPIHFIRLSQGNNKRKLLRHNQIIPNFLLQTFLQKQYLINHQLQILTQFFLGQFLMMLIIQMIKTNLINFLHTYFILLVMFLPITRQCYCLGFMILYLFVDEILYWE